MVWWLLNIYLLKQSQYFMQVYLLDLLFNWLFLELAQKTIVHVFRFNFQHLWRLKEHYSKVYGKLIRHILMTFAKKLNRSFWHVIETKYAYVCHHSNLFIELSIFVMKFCHHYNSENINSHNSSMILNQIAMESWFI